MTNITSTLFRIPQQALKGGVVLLPLQEYRDLQAQAVPTYYLTGKKALALDRLVEKGLKEHREGKTILASSMREALQIYETKTKYGRTKKRN
ncbi:MAG: hypothetical protein V1704_00680 [Candidatus Vogelbacteria bacterium]